MQRFMLPSLPQRNARRNERNRWFLLALKGYRPQPLGAFKDGLLDILTAGDEDLADGHVLIRLRQARSTSAK